MNPPHIGTLGEKSLHASLKSWYAQPGDLLETRVAGYVIDIVRGDILIEIQTGNFSALKRKLPLLLETHPVHLLHPIPEEKWILRQRANGALVTRRRSPKRGGVLDLFRELVYIPHLLSHKHFSLEVLLTQEEEILRDDGRGSWRRKKWSVYDRRLLGITGSISFQNPADYLDLLPASLPEPFTNQDLASALRCRPALAQKMTYTLRQMGGLQVCGKRGNTLLQTRT